MPDTVTKYGARPAKAALYEPNKDPRLRRIPVVPTTMPRLAIYIVCVVVDDPYYGGVEPNLSELQLVRRYLDYRLEWYNDRYRRHMEQRPYDLDDGVNTLTLLKRAEGEWCYRVFTWTMGPHLRPAYNEPKQDLAEVLDRYEHFTDHWKRWQAEHPA